MSCWCNKSEIKRIDLAVNIDLRKCIGCSICASVCPSRAITIVNGKAHVDKRRCVECGVCISRCPNYAISIGVKNMKIVVATTKGGLEDNVSPVFGRCQTFTIVDVEGKEIKNSEIVPNSYAGAMSGAGIQAGQFAVSKGANVVIAGNYGPNVSTVFSQANVEMIPAQGKVDDVIKKYLNRELKATTQATAQPQIKFGMGQGMGGGMGMGRGMMYQPVPQPFMPMQMPKEQAKQMLKQQINGLEQQLKQMKKRLEELGG
ncbi:MAG: NifB/NifX family molybdenum-iron cluster-binding protein [Thermoplasmatales archaeon]|nr:NifB/NifX family molybdenum-iron cluster-binding protein [Thermoplasmatales archaeon]